MDLRSQEYFDKPFGVFSAIASPEALFKAMESCKVGCPLFIVQDGLALSDIEIYFLFILYIVNSVHTTANNPSQRANIPACYELGITGDVKLTE